MEEGLQCFAKAKGDAQNASATAQLAFNISENAKQVCKSLSYARIRPLVYSTCRLSLVDMVHLCS